MAKEMKKKLSKYQIAGGRIKRFFYDFSGHWMTGKKWKIEKLCIAH
jgi:hypothetical protein